MTLTADIIARIAVVVFAIIFLIAFKRRKTLFTVKNSVRVGQLHILEGIVSREIRDANPPAVALRRDWRVCPGLLHLLHPGRRLDLMSYPGGGCRHGMTPGSKLVFVAV